MGQEDAKKLAGKFLGQPKFANVRDRWRNVQTLIIDESKLAKMMACSVLDQKFSLHDRWCLV